MNKRKLIDFYLPFPWNIHARILAFSVIGSVLFQLISQHTVYFQFVITGTLIMALDAEIIFWVSRALFNSVKNSSPREITFSILWRVLVFLLLIIGVGTMVAAGVMFLMSLLSGNSLDDSMNLIRNFAIKENLISLVIASFLATMAFFFMLWQEAMKSAFKAREQMLIYQSETLKSQVNPHFLFNSLNTLSSLIPIDPEQAELFTQKLSVIYRYILENRDAETVSLDQEISFVNDYYFLQKIRDEEKIKLTIEINDPNCRVLPISLQLLVENAFKHNAATTERPLQVTIVQKDGFIEVRNNLQPKSQLSPSSGLGLKNLAERVKIHTGKSLEIERGDKEFVVRMPVV
jgi:sensor histidine kinase YesM